MHFRYYLPQIPMVTFVATLTSIVAATITAVFKETQSAVSSLNHLNYLATNDLITHSCAQYYQQPNPNTHLVPSKMSC